MSRRNVLSGLAAAATTGCGAPQAPRQAAVAPDVAPDQYLQTAATQNPLA